MEEDILGFINGNVARQKVLEVLDAPRAPMDAVRIGKTLRIAPLIVNRTLAELEERGLIAANDRIYTLTGDGKELLSFIRLLL